MESAGFGESSIAPVERLRRIASLKVDAVRSKSQSLTERGNSIGVVPNRQVSCDREAFFAKMLLRHRFVLVAEIELRIP